MPEASPSIAQVLAQVQLLSGSHVSGTHSHANNLLEQDIFERLVTKRTKVIGIILDLSALTQNATVRFYTKPDGTNYRAANPTTYTAGTDNPLFFIEAGLQCVNTDFRVTLQSAVLEGAVRNVPYRYLIEQMEQ